MFRMENPQVFYTWEWAIAVQRAYAKLITPLVILACNDQELIGVAALAEKEQGRYVFLTSDTSDYCEFLCEPAIRSTFVESIFAELQNRGATKVVLTNIPVDSQWPDEISRASSKARYHLHMRRAYDCAQVHFPEPENRAFVKQGVLAKKKFRRNIRELMKRGGVEVRHETEWSAIHALLPEFIRAHIARFLETGKPSNLLPEERRAFLEYLARELSSSGWVVFSRLLVGEMTAAWNYGFQFEGSWFWYQPTVSDSCPEFSPGDCLLSKIVEQACDSPELTVVDLGLGAEGYKERFANASRQTVYCELNRSGAQHWRAMMRHRAATVAMASPKVESLVRSAFASISETRDHVHRLGLMGMLKAAGRRVRRRFFSQDRVDFFEWPAHAAAHHQSYPRLERLGSDILGTAALQYGNDPSSLRFLMRSAQRLRSGRGEAFVLVGTDGIPLHFCWVTEFQGFYMAELNRRLDAPCENSVMIFDCFTPEPARGHGFFPQAIALLAAEMKLRGKSVWIFGAETNRSSVRGIEKSGFQYKFTLGRRRILFVDRTRDSMPSEGVQRAEGSLSSLKRSRS